MDRQLDIPKDLDHIKIPQAKEGGCAACNFTGYRGRKGLYELFVVNDEMEKLILKNPPVSEIKKQLIKNGMITMYQSGLIEVVLGQTTLEEVDRVVEQD